MLPTTSEDQARWAPCRELLDGVELLLNAALRFQHERIEDLSGSDKAKLAELRAHLQIDEGDYSRWGTGKTKRSTIPTTRRLRALFGGDAYIDRKGDRALTRYDRKFAKELQAFWSLKESKVLGDVRLLLEAHAQKLTRLEKEDELTKSEQIRATLAVAAGAASRNTASQNFVLDPNPDTLPPGLRSTRKIIHRETIIENIRALLRRRAGEGILVTMTGPPLSGKSAIFQQLASEISAPQHGEKLSLAMLHVDFKKAQRPLRSLYLAIRAPAGVAPSGASISAELEADDDDERASTDIEFLQSHITHRTRSRNLVTFCEGFSEIVHDDIGLDELAGFLRWLPFRRGFTLLESDGEAVPALGLAQTEIPLPPFSSDQAIDFLVKEHLPPDQVREAVGLLADDLLHPGHLHKAAVAFDPSILQITGKTVTVDDLVLMIMLSASEIADEVVKSLSADESESRGAMVSLMAMAVFGEVSIDQATLDRAGLSAIPRQRLIRLGWLDQPRGESLVGFGLDALRAAAVVTLSGRSTSRVGSRAEELRMAIKGLTAEFLQQRTGIAVAAIEQAQAWLHRHVPDETEIRAHLLASLILDSTFDPVSPIAEREELAAASDFFRRGREEGDIDAAIASLTIHARERFGGSARPLDLVKADFLQSLEGTSTLIRNGSRLDSRELFALDNAIYVGSRRFHLSEKGLAVRNAILPALTERERLAIETQDSRWISACLSFLINVADLELDLGARNAALASSERAERLVKKAVWLTENSWKEWLLCRLLVLRARLTLDPTEQKDLLAEAVQHAAKSLTYAPDDPRCVRFYLRTVRRVIDADGDEDARQRHVDTARVHLEAIFGPSEVWDVSVRAQFAALMRREARRAWNIEYQQARAKEALSLLQGGTGKGRDVENDAQALLVKARLQAFLGDRAAALATCEKALRLEATSASWLLKLRLLDSEATDRHWSDRTDLAPSAFFSPMTAELRRAIREFRQSVSNAEQDRSVSSVLLWIARREWQSHGSLERQVAMEMSRQGTDYAGLPKREKLKRVQSAFRKRGHQLVGIKKALGDSVELVESEFENTREWVRCKSVLSGEPPETASAIDIIDKGLKRFPGSHVLLLRRAEYLQYIWDIDAATEEFRTLRATTTDGDLRRRASVSLVRCLHTAVVHREDAEGEQRLEWLNEAKDVLAELAGSFYEAEEVAILREYVALESGDQVDWSSLEEVFNKVVAVIDGFPSTLIRNFDAMQLASEREPTTIAEALQKNFAVPEILGYAGLLYLRRAEKNIGNQLQEDFQRAVALLRAQALIERSWSGQEYPATSFRIGRAIVSASKQFLSENPINGLDTENKRDQLALAEAKFDSAGQRGAGEFRNTARRRQSEVSQLRSALRR